MSKESKRGGWSIINTCSRCGSNQLENDQTGMTFWSTWLKESDQCEHITPDKADEGHRVLSGTTSGEKRS
jgi:hypothetical protein